MFLWSPRFPEGEGPFAEDRLHIISINNGVKSYRLTKIAWCFFLDARAARVGDFN